MTTLMTKDSKVPERVQQRPHLVPRCDIYENDVEYMLIAEIAGVGQDQLTIHLEEDQLTIDGKRAEPIAKSMIRREFDVYDFHRSFIVPREIDHRGIHAELKYGLLRVHLPKSSALRPRQVPVQTG